MKRLSLISIACAAAFATLRADAAARYAALFGSHAVLQRGCEIPVWGFADPGAKVSVALDGEKLSATADESGRWEVRFGKKEAGTDHTLTLSSEGQDDIVLDDIAIGDVWICGGQSNMEMSFGWGVQNGDEELKNADFPGLRLFHVQRAVDIAPRSDVNGTWARCAGDTVRSLDFSACAFFFGRKLQSELGIPVGLVEDCWSGSYAQTWLSLETMESIPELAGAAQSRRAEIAAWLNGGKDSYDADLAAYEEAMKKTEASDGPFDKKARLPVTFEQLVDPNFDGIVWFRRTVELTEEQAAAEARLTLGAIDDEDITKINGVMVGETKQYNLPRDYKIPAGILKAGANEILVQAKDNGQRGGFTSPADALALKLGEETIPLAGEWEAKWCGTKRPVDPSNRGCNVPAACYYGQLCPTFPLAVKGVIWYQGCSNVGGHAVYEKLLPAVAADWKKGYTCADGKLPFYQVQLAAYLQTHEEPVESAWAAMRWSQMKIGETMPDGGAAVAIDVGNHTDIHPKDKRTVGERLARLALVRTYGADLVESGPIPLRAEAADGGVAVSFKNASVLKSSDSGAIKGFQIAGADGPFVWAEADVKDGKILVKAPDGMTPARVRYAWDDYPVCNLVGAENLPCGPFEFSVE